MRGISVQRVAALFGRMCLITYNRKVPPSEGSTGHLGVDYLKVDG